MANNHLQHWDAALGAYIKMLHCADVKTECVEALKLAVSARASRFFTAANADPASLIVELHELGKEFHPKHKLSVYLPNYPILSKLVEPDTTLPDAEVKTVAIRLFSVPAGGPLTFWNRPVYEPHEQVQWVLAQHFLSQLVLPASVCVSLREGNANGAEVMAWMVIPKETKALCSPNPIPGLLPHIEHYHPGKVQVEVFKDVLNHLPKKMPGEYVWPFAPELEDQVS